MFFYKSAVSLHCTFPSRPLILAVLVSQFHKSYILHINHWPHLPLATDANSTVITNSNSWKKKKWKKIGTKRSIKILSMCARSASKEHYVRAAPKESHNKSWWHGACWLRRNLRPTVSQKKGVSVKPDYMPRASKTLLKTHSDAGGTGLLFKSSRLWRDFPWLAEVWKDGAPRTRRAPESEVSNSFPPRATSALWFVTVRLCSNYWPAHKHTVPCSLFELIRSRKPHMRINQRWTNIIEAHWTLH